MSAELIIYGLIAAGLVFWLRSILGTRHGDERSRPNPFASDNQPKPPVKGNENNVHALTEHVDDEVKPAINLPHYVEIPDAAQIGFDDIVQIDRSFDIAHFIQGAETAFIIIVEAFAKGERETLQPLLSDSVFKTFDSVIRVREDNGESVETEIQAIRKMAILDVEMMKSVAKATIQFIADETCVIRDKEGNIQSGSSERTTQINDIWVFEKDLKSRDPIWRLVETRDGEPEDHKTPIPDAS